MIAYGFIISSLGQGGAEGQLLRLALGLSERGYKISVMIYASNNRKHFLNQFDLSGIDLTIQNREEKWALSRIARAIISIRGFVKCKKADVYYTHLHMNNVLVKFATSFLDVRVVYGIRTSLLGYKFLYKLQHRILFRKSYFLINNIYNLKEFVSNGLVHASSDYLINGYEILNNKSELVAMKFTTFGLIGRLSSEKRFHEIAKKWKEIAPTGFQLVIRGSKGNSYEKLREHLSEDIIYEGVRSIENLFTGIDAVIVSSAYEGCPNVIFEAGLRSKLVLISAESNTGEWIENGKTGFVYNNFVELMDLLRLISVLSEVVLLQIICNWRKQIEKTYNLSAMIDSFIESTK